MFTNWICLCSIKPLLEWDHFLGGFTAHAHRQIPMQYSIGVSHCGQFKVYDTCPGYGPGVIPINFQSNPIVGDVFRFRVNFKKSTVEVYQNEQCCGVMHNGIKGDIIPAASNDSGGAKYSIRFDNLGFFFRSLCPCSFLRGLAINSTLTYPADSLFVHRAVKFLS